MAENLTFNLDVNSSQAVASINTFFDAFEKGAAQAKSKLNTAFNQTIQTDIKVEFKNGALVAKEVQSLKQESNRLAQAYKAVNGELGKTPNELKRQRTILKTLLGDTQKFKQGTRTVSNEWKTLTSKIKQTESALKTMSTSGGGGLAGLMTKFIGIQTAANLATAGLLKMTRQIGELVQTAFRMETLSLQMEAFVGSAAGAEAAFDQFLDIAANSPLNLEQVASAGKIMMAFGMETDQAVKATEQLALVSAATGGDINLLARNMGQIVAQGRAYTRDLTQFAIQGIPIWEQLSVATGKNVSELKDMAKNGQITGKEVGAALDLMTEKGTAFFEVGERMKETFAGRFAAIEAATQNLAKEFIDAFNTVDKAMLGVVSNGMKLFASGLNLVAEQIEIVAAALAGLIVGLGTFIGMMVVLNWGAIASGISAIVLAVKSWAAAQAILNIAQAFFAGLTGNWVAIASGVAAAGVAVGLVANQMNKAKEETMALDGEIVQLTDDTGKLTDKALEYATKAGNKDAVKAYKEQQEIVTGLNQELGRAVEILEAQQEARNEIFKEEQANIKTLMDAEKDKVDQAKSAMEEAKSAIDEKYEKEKTHLDETLSLIRQKYDEEIGQLRAKTPAEQKLYDLQKKQLEAKVAAGGLDQEEALRLQVRLERMNANEKIQTLITKKKEEEAVVSKSLNELEKERKVQLGEVEAKYDSIADKSKTESDRLKADLAASKTAQKAFNDSIDASIKSAETLGKEVKSTNTAVQTQQALVQQLATDYANAANQASRLAAEIRSANRAAANAPASGGGGGSAANRFAGGPVSGGTPYTVNELGKEAFLSASGALSMINAPSFGTWKAPGAGTVIPAHLTSQLNVPSGGVNINKTSGASAGAAGAGMSMSSMVRAITGALGGDTVNNSVTIQSSNPTQSANNMMVQLQRLRRGRYGR